MYHIGVDIGGTNIKIGLIDDDLQIVGRSSIRFEKTGGRQVAATLADAIRDVLNKAEVPEEELQSIGVVVPGSITTDSRSVIHAHNLDFHDVPLCEYIEAHFPNVPVRMANDANGAALAELYKGALQGAKTAILITLGTGVGGGIIMNGKMFNGGKNQGTEPGHVALGAGGEPCTCGNRDCIEVYCSATALVREGVRAMQADPASMLFERSGGDASCVDAKLVTDCAKAGDEAAMKVFDRFVEHLATACASFFNLLDFEIIAIGGGLCGAGEFLFKPLREKTKPKCFYATPGEIVPATLGNDAGMIGAALLHKDATLR
ncbi:MAG: ROK family protein [Oscillospiraceae bacterium]|nr:ROK family protein [Oscillospiraceae bacterium]